jgi:hypothetical protein
MTRRQWGERYEEKAMQRSRSGEIMVLPGIEARESEAQEGRRGRHRAWQGPDIY